MMTDTLVGVNPPEPEEPAPEPQRELSAEEIAVIEGVVRQARDSGVALTGPDGLLKALTKSVIETALDEEMAEYLGYDRHAPEGATGPTPATGNDQRRC